MDWFQSIADIMALADVLIRKSDILYLPILSRFIYLAPVALPCHHLEFQTYEAQQANGMGLPKNSPWRASPLVRHALVLKETRQSAHVGQTTYLL